MICLGNPLLDGQRSGSEGMLDPAFVLFVVAGLVDLAVVKRSRSSFVCIGWMLSCSVATIGMKDLKVLQHLLVHLTN